jgi:hypothetical protein
MMVTIVEAALMAHRDERTVRRWITQGLLVDHRDVTGRRVVVLREVMLVEAHVRSAPRRRQAQRLADLLNVD